MFSKISMLLLLMVGLTACDRFLKSNQDNSNEAQTVQIEFKEGQCLKEVPVQLQKFLSDEDGLGASVPCVQSALKAFMRLTRGEKPDSYQSKEMQDFFNTYLLKENKITDEFQEDIMKLKILVVGGASDIVTRAELEKFILFLGDLEPQVQKFKGKIRLLSLKMDRDKVQLQDLTELKKGMTVLADFVLKNTKFTASQYQWTDFLSFLGNLHKFVGQFKALEEVLAWMPLVDSAKAVFLGSNSTLQTPQDWSDTKIWLINSYGTILRYHYQIMGTAFTKPSEWISLVAWIDELFVVLETAPLMKEKKIFDAFAIDKMIDAAYQKPLVTTKLPAELIKQTYRKALAYFVEPSAMKSDPIKIKGLTEDHLKVLRVEYHIWKATQVFINRSYNDSMAQSLETLRQRFKTIDSQGFPAVPMADRPEYNQAWQDFKELLSSNQVIVHNNQMKLLVGYQTAAEPVSFVGANMLNGVRTLSRFALKGYGDKESKSVFKRKISKQRMIDLEQNFREFGRAVGFFDPDKVTAGKETFDQANLLVYHSNGDAWVDSREMVEVLSFLISGGQTLLVEIYQGLDKNRCLLQEMDAFKRPWVDEACFLRSLRSDVGSYFNNLPEAVQFLNSLSDAQFLEAYKALKKVSIGPRHRPGQLDSGEVRSMATILHFVEAIVVMYDSNRNKVLDVDEVLSAFPRFKDVIKEQALKENFLAGFVLDDIFLFLVYNGKKPNGAWDITTIITEKAFGRLGDVDKLMIYKLLGVMKDYLTYVPPI